MNKVSLLFCMLLPLAIVACTDPAEKDETVPVETVIISEKYLELEKGGSELLTAEIVPENATDRSLFWESSDPSVATVNRGIVIAIAPGHATVTVKSGDITETCEVSVIIPVKSISISATNLDLEVGKTSELTVGFFPEDATDRMTEWSSSNPSVASVNNGIVVAMAPGNTLITVRNGEFSQTCTVTVHVALESLELDKKEVSLMVGKTIELHSIIKPDNATIRTGITLWSSNPQVASVNGNGLVTAVSTGTAVIYVTIDGKQDSCIVTVLAMTGNIEGTEKENWK